VLADVQSLRNSDQTIVRPVDCPNPFRLDSSLLRKILVYLLSNALKYSGRSSVVTVHAQASSDSTASIQPARDDMAAMVGTARESLVRILSEFN
jgi:signal transduction histidine kinase